MIFDARTGFLFLSLLCLVISLALWTVLYRQRTLALDLWCGAGLVAAAATLLFALRPFLPGMLGYTLAALLAFLMLVLKLHALRLELQQTEPIRNQAILMLAFIAGYEIVRRELGEIPLYLLATLAILAMNARVAWWAWRLSVQPGRHNARWIAASFALMAAMYAFRLVNAGLGVFDARLMTQGYDALLLALVAVVSMIVSNIAWLGLALDRLVQTQVAQQEHQRILDLLSASLGDELSQPLTAVLTNAQVASRTLRSGIQYPEPVLDLLDKIEHNTNRASRIIENVRGFIRPAAPCQEPVDLTRLIHEISELVTTEAQARQTNIHLRLPQRSLRVMGDPIQLWQTALNLLRHAMVATSEAPASEIQVRLLECDGQAALRIHAGGAADGPIWSFLDSAHNAPDRASKGLARATTNAPELGLSLLDAIAEQHGGELTLNHLPDGGSWIELRLPLISRRAQVAQDGPAERLTRRAVTVTDRRLAERCARGRIAIIDDDAAIRESLLTLLESEGYACEAYSSSELDPRPLNEDPAHFPGPFCLLIDLAASESIDAEYRAPLTQSAAPPILLMGVANRAAEAVSALRDGGAIDFLIKPVDAALLLNAVGRALAVSARRQREQARHRELAARFALLTEREREIARQVALGQRNQAIAEALGIALRTVKRHRQQVMEKLEVDTLVDLVRIVDEADEANRTG